MRSRREDNHASFSGLIRSQALAELWVCQISVVGPSVLQVLYLISHLIQHYQLFSRGPVNWNECQRWGKYKMCHVRGLFTVIGSIQNGENQAFNGVYVYVVFLICFKTNHVKFISCQHCSLKLQWTKDSLKNTVWNRWCFWCHKLPCNQSDQHVIVNQWISELSEWVAHLHIHRIAYSLLNEARVYSYIQSILRHEKNSRKKHLNM